MIQAGKLRHRLTIQKFTVAKNSYGEDIKTWADYHKTWGSVEPLRGKEYFDSQQIVPEVETRMRIRYKTGIAPTMRVSYDSRTFDILSVIDPDDRNIMLELMVKENPTS